jgi:hypothetical protein
MQHDQDPADSSGQYYPKSDGIFAEWQPRYAGHGIPTYPVRIIGKDKKPAVSNYLKMGFLGAGYVTAPPSRAAKCDYRFIQGGLDDIDRLPVMRVLRKHARF